VGRQPTCRVDAPARLLQEEFLDRIAGEPRSKVTFEIT